MKNISKKTSQYKYKLISFRYEGIYIFFIGLAIFFFVSLASYNVEDPGWSKTGKTDIIMNIGGSVGAWLADIVFFIFGCASYGIPLIMIYIIWLSLLVQNKKITVTEMFIKCNSLLIIIISFSCLLTMYFPNMSLPNGTGGIIGNILLLTMMNKFNHIGTNLIVIIFIFINFTIFSKISILWIIKKIVTCLLIHIDYIGNMVIKFVHFISRSKQTNFSFYNKNIPNNNKIYITDNVPIKNNITLNQYNPIQANDNSILPKLSLLEQHVKSYKNSNFSSSELEMLSKNIELQLSNFGVKASVVSVCSGPVITRFELQLAIGTKINRITSIAKDLARSLSVISVRIVEIIPGKSVIGIELPNINREIINLHEILSSAQYIHAHSPLLLALGKDISGYPVIVDLAKMPHLLVAGTTGSGKSVFLNSLLLSLLYKYTSKELKLILIDPKMLELSVYSDIPHLLTPIITDMNNVEHILNWCINEIDRRYKIMSTLGVRNIAGYNNKIQEKKKNHMNDDQLLELPYIVIISDEYADMIMVAGKKIEDLITRIAQKARAAGIHLILATQRPSVDVITGLIKANISTRIAFQVSSKIDSRTILDQSGAEQLLGAGDMLYLPSCSGIPIRIHGAFVTDEEVHRVVQYLRSKKPAKYIEEILNKI